MDKNKLAVDMFNKAALVYEDKYMDVSSYAESLNLFCENLDNKSASILELACGPGNITKYLIDKSHKYEILATDLAPAMLELARKNCPTANFQILDCREISKLDKKFNAILSGFCFPYLDKNEAENFISDSKQLLSPDGLFYISTMHGSYSDSGIKKSATTGDEVYFYLHESEFIEKTLINNDFKIIDSRVQIDPTSKDEMEDLIVLAQKR